MAQEQINKMSLVKLALLLTLLPLVLSGNSRRSRGTSDLPAPFIYSTEELNNWIPPPEVRNALKYFYSGTDKKGRPVFITEMNTWDILGLTSTEEGRKLYRKAMEQLCLRLGGNSSWTDGTNGFILIEQSKDLNVKQLSGPYTIPAWIQGIQLLERLIQKYDSKPNIIPINANCVKETLLGLVQLATTTIGQYVQPFGTNTTEWTAKLDEIIPVDQRPAELGGSSDWRAVRYSYK